MAVRSKVFHYHIDLQWQQERKGLLQAEGKPTLEVATPPEFKGHPGIWTPEDLFVASVSSCLMSTFIGMAARAGLPIHGYDCHAEGDLESVDGNLVFTRVTLSPHIVVNDTHDVAQASTILHQAKADCLVARSLRAEVLMNEPKIDVVPAPSTQPKP